MRATATAPERAALILPWPTWASFRWGRPRALLPPPFRPAPLLPPAPGRASRGPKLSAPIFSPSPRVLPSLPLSYLPFSSTLLSPFSFFLPAHTPSDVRGGIGADAHGAAGRPPHGAGAAAQAPPPHPRSGAVAGLSRPPPARGGAPRRRRRRRCHPRGRCRACARARTRTRGHPCRGRCRCLCCFCCVRCRPRCHPARALCAAVHKGPSAAAGLAVG